MKKKFWLTLTILAVLVAGVQTNVMAASQNSARQLTGNIYYVATTGSDSNPGTAAAPFKTFAKAAAMLGPGSTLYIEAGTYTEQIKVTNSGADGAWITIKPIHGNVLIDLNNTLNPAVTLQGSYISVENLEIKGSNDICVKLSGKYQRASGLFVHDCQTHGIHVSGQNIEIIGNTVVGTSLMNQSRTLSSGWGSGIKVALGGTNVLIKNNTVYHNYGEGIAATRSSIVTIHNNDVYDNFSVNIYVDNSFYVWVEKNLVTCHPNSGFERNGSPAAGIAMGEEYYSGWGTQLNHVTIANNIVANCKRGVYYYGASASTGGIKNSTIAYNTLWNSTDTALGIIYTSGQTNTLIANNIIWQANNKLAYIENTTGLSFQNNLWKVLPPAAAQGKGDKLGDPGFLTTPGYSTDSFKLGNSSPAISSGADIGISTDLLGNMRGPAFDMGALQFAGTTTSATATLIAITPPPSTPAASPTPMPATQTAIPTTQTTSTALPTIAATSSPAPTITALPTYTATSPAPTITSTSTLLPPTFTATSAPTLPPPTATQVPLTFTPTAEPTTNVTGMTVYNDTNPALNFSGDWQDVQRDRAYEKSFKAATVPGSSVTLQFTGQAVSLLYTAGKNFGKMEIYIDSQLVSVLDQQARQNKFQQRWDYQGPLQPGGHEIKLVFVSTDQSKGSIDAILIR